jgi:hypothetical protein
MGAQRARHNPGRTVQPGEGQPQPGAPSILHESVKRA